MSLSELDLKICYRSDRDDIINDFYEKVLTESCKYERAVGYFSTQSLLLLHRGLEHFEKNNGKIFLIASPQLNEEDIRIIKNGYENREKVLKKIIMNSLYIPEEDKDILTLNKIEKLIAMNRLSIRIAFNKNGGIFHEKIGIVTDELGNKIAFTGSLNETNNAFKNNFESIDLFFSWDKRDCIRVNEKQKDFDELWNNHTNGVEVFDFTKAIQYQLLEYRKDGLLNVNKELEDNLDKIILSEPGIPSFIEIRDYQKQAYKAWNENNYNGILQMATGTGKTITACYSLVNLYNELNARKEKQVVIVLVPYKHLVDQWSDELRNFGYSPYKVSSIKNSYTKIKND